MEDPTLHIQLLSTERREGRKDQHISRQSSNYNGKRVNVMRVE